MADLKEGRAAVANPEHVERLKEGVEVWNKWRRDNRVAHIDLRGTEWYGADLSFADFSSADLSTINLNTVDLSEANLSNANLLEADLRYTILRAADLTGATLTRAYLAETLFAHINLTSVIGLDTCVHQRPSIIDHRTLQQSGPLPLKFLRGVGLPERLINSLPSLLGKDEYHSCFISYSTKDHEFAERIHDDLQNKGVRCWFSPHDIHGGEKLHEQIGKAIQLYDKLLLILSEASMSSEWVKTEIYNARQRELREKRQMLFPISLVSFEYIKAWKAFDADTGKDLAREIREYFIPDFANWIDHSSYTRAFDRLIRDLKTLT
jgi:uncharacterized protein YjbI with pentapeptide repeats